jgi:hypothetical protein
MTWRSGFMRPDGSGKKNVGQQDINRTKTDYMNIVW